MEKTTALQHSSSKAAKVLITHSRNIVECQANLLLFIILAQKKSVAWTPESSKGPNKQQQSMVLLEAMILVHEQLGAFQLMQIRDRVSKLYSLLGFVRSSVFEIFKDYKQTQPHNDKLGSESSMKGYIHSYGYQQTSEPPPTLRSRIWIIPLSQPQWCQDFK